MGDDCNIKEYREIFESTDNRYRDGFNRLNQRVDEIEKVTAEMRGIIASMDTSFKSMREEVTRFYEKQFALMWKWVFFMTAIFAVLLGAGRTVEYFLGN